MPIIGLHGYRYAILTENEDGTFEYGDIKTLPGATDVKISPKSDSAEFYSDDGLSETSTSLGATEVEIGLGDLPLEVRAEILGQRFEKGVLKENDTFNPPYVAFGFVAPKSKPVGAQRMKWLTKGSPEPLEEEAKTKGDKIDFQTQSIKYKFMRRSDGERSFTADTDLKEAPTEEQFFSKEFLTNGEVSPLSKSV